MRAGQPARDRRAVRARRVPERRRVRGVGLAHPVPALRRAGHHRPLGAAHRSRSRRSSRRPRRRSPRRSRRRTHMPILEVFTNYPKRGPHRDGHAAGGEHSYYIFTVIVLTYIKDFAKQGKGPVLQALLIGSVVHFIWIPIVGALSDRVGRRPLYLTGAVGVAVWSFFFFGLLDSEQPAARSSLADRRRPDAARADVRPAGGVLLRAVRHLGALHRRLGGLPARVDLRRRHRPDRRGRSCSPPATATTPRRSRST